MDWRGRAGTAAVVFLGALLLVAMIGKAVDPLVFVQQIRNEELTGIFSANTVALIALALEAGLGTALILGVRSWLVLGPTSLLVAFFLFLTGRNLVYVLQGLRDPSYDCGCFGFLWERTAVEAFWQDILLLIPPLIIAFWSRRYAAPEFFPAGKLATAGAVVVLTLGYVILGPGLPADFKHRAASTGEQTQFTRVDRMELWQGGQPLESARIYESADGLQFLILGSRSDRLLLVDPPEGTIQVLALQDVRESSEATVRLVDDPEILESVEFEFSALGVEFSLEGERYRLRTPEIH